MSDTKSRTHLLLTIAVVLALVGAISGVAYVCRYGFPARAVSDSGRPPILSIVVSGDTAGWIVPCGCTSNQSGGLLRRGTFVRQLQERGEVMLADAGGAAAGSSRYQRVKFEAFLQGELAMGLTAHNLGASEVTLGADYLREVGSRLHVPFVSANVTDTRGKPLAEPLRIVEKNGVSVAMTGGLSQRFAMDGVKVEEPRTAILRLLATRSPFGGVDLGDKGRCDSLMVLAYMPEDELINLATNLPEADWIIGGPTGQSILPHVLGPTWVAS